MAAEGCATIRASDLPDSASDPVKRLRVMGDFSISSEDGDDADTYVNEASRHIIVNVTYALIAVDRARFYLLKSQSDLRIPSRMQILAVRIFESKLL